MMGEKAHHLLRTARAETGEDERYAQACPPFPAAWPFAPLAAAGFAQVTFIQPWVTAKWTIWARECSFSFSVARAL